MDSIIGIEGNDFVLIAADQTSAYSIMKFKSDEDKLMTLDNKKVLGIGGPVGDRVQFGEYMDKNIRLQKFINNGIEMDTHETAHFIRSELAKSIRKSPIQANSMLAGYDENGPSLYWLDYMGTMTKVKHSAQGYAMYFLLSIFDRLYKQDMQMQEALDLMKYCIHELKVRFLMGDDNFIIKCVDKDGIRIIQQ